MDDSDTPSDTHEERKLGVQGYLQLFRVKINDVHYILFGPPITLGEPEPIHIQEFQINEIIDAEPLLKSIIRAMSTDGTSIKSHKLQ